MANEGPLQVNPTPRDNLVLGVACGAIGAAVGGGLYSLVRMAVKGTVITANQLLEGYELVPKSKG